MKIGLATLQFPPTDIGGIGTYLRELAPALAALGHDVTVLHNSASAGRLRVEHVDGFRLIEQPWPVPNGFVRRMIRPEHRVRIRLAGAMATAYGVHRHLAGCDVIEVPDWKAQGLLVRHPRHVCHLHLLLRAQDEAQRRARDRGARLASFLEERSVRRADAVTASSAISARYPHGGEVLPLEQVGLVPPPIDLDRWYPPAAPSMGPPTVLFVGRLEERKRPEIVVQAAARLRPLIPDLRVVFCGPEMRIGSQGYFDMLHGLADELGVNIDVVGPTSKVDELRRLYHQATVVAVPSRFETLSVVALEAMACATPVVMTPEVGAADLLPADLRRKFVTAGDAEGFVEGLRPLLADQQAAAQLGSAARRHLTTCCTPEAAAAARIAIYESLGA